MTQRLPFTLAFTAFALFLLLGPLKPYLVETAALTPFYVDEFTVGKMLSEPCGLLFQVAAGMQSCFARPWLGTALFIAVLIAVAYVQRWAFRISDAWFGLCWVAPFALLTNYTQLGYLIYTLKHPAVAFAPVLGMLVAIALMGLWLRLQSWWWNVAFVLLVPTVGFWLFGVYGLLVLPVLGFCEAGVARWGLREDSFISFKTSSMFSEVAVERLGLHELTRQTRGYHILLGLALFALGFLLPVLFRAVLQQPLDFETGLLGFSNAERQLRLPAIFTVVPLTIFLFFRLSGNRRWQLITASAAFMAAAVAAYTYAYRDANFLNTLQMKHATEDGEWEQVLRLSRENKQEPTRAQVCLTRLALFKTGRMGDELFTYPDGSAAYHAPQQNQWLRMMIGPLLYYHYGKTGFAYRWAMEDLVEYGERPADLRYLYSVARLNGEEALARRYERTLARTLLYKHAYAHATSEDAAIRPLMNFTDQLDGDNGLVEFYLLNSFALSQGGSRPMVELSLMNGLITKNLSAFWQHFLALLPTWQGHIPTHYQEAALMVAQLQGNAPVNHLPIDPAISQRFQRLVEASARLGDNAANAAALRPEFGNTYWYYYFFMEGLKTN